MAWGLSSFVWPAAGALVMGQLGAPALWLGCLALGVLGAAGQIAAAPLRARRAARAASGESALET
jgi:hypothetical protein